MDVLADVLSSLELKGWLSSRTEIVAPWRFEFATSCDAIFHILRFGGGYLYVEEESEPLWIEDGDIMLLPHGHAHILCDKLASPLTQSVYLDYTVVGEHQIFPLEEKEAELVMLCGAFRFEDLGAHPLLRYLPRVIHIPGEQGEMAQGFADIVRLITYESASRLPGSEVMLRKLSEMLFIQVIRIWIERQASLNGNALTALSDLPVSTALGLIHQSPEHGWKVEELAERVALSRSAFSSRFTRLVGEPPMKYLTRWRMCKASLLLRNEVKVEKIAQQLGYDSEVAFRKAFKREVGVSPASYRRQGRSLRRESGD